MKKKYISGIISMILFTLLLMISLVAKGQITMPSELNNNSIKDQLKYIDDHTRIYENYRAIREDMFQKIKGNITDTLNKSNYKITILNNGTATLNRVIDSLTTSLETTRTSLEEVTRTKNSIKVIGIEVNKTSYNAIMWIIIVGLLVILVFGFLAFQRTLKVHINIKKDLADLKDEFEAYRKTSREAREKLSMSHFIELKKLRGE